MRKRWILLLAASVCLTGCVNVRRVERESSSAYEENVPPSESMSEGASENGSEDTSQTDKTLALEKNGVSFYSAPMAMYPGIEGNEIACNGSLYEGSMLISGLKIYDYTKPETPQTVICNVPGCLHNPDPEKDRECLLKKCSGPSVIYQDKVFIIGTSEIEKEKIYGLFAVGLDGDGLRLIREFDGDVVSCNNYPLIADGNMLYFTVREEENSISSEDGYVNTEYVKVSLYQLDMEKESLKELYTLDGYDVIFGTLYYSEGKILTRSMIQTKSFEEIGITQSEYYQNFDKYYDQRYELLGLQGKTVCISVDTGEADELSVYPENTSDWLLEALAGNKAVIWHEEELELFDIAENRLEPWLKRDAQTEYTVEQWEDFILVKTVKRDSQGEYSHTEYELCPDDTLERYRINVPEGKDLVLLDESDTMLFLALTPPTVDSDSSSWEYQLISKEEFLSWVEKTPQ